MSRTAYACAIELLARREHSKKQLIEKLTGKGFDDKDEINRILMELESQGYQSDQRFASAYAQSRISKGFGRRRIIMELKQKGIADELIASLMLDFKDSDDFESSLIVRVWSKKFKSMPTQLIDKQKQTRYLLYRGFDLEEISKLFEYLTARSDL